MKNKQSHDYLVNKTPIKDKQNNASGTKKLVIEPIRNAMGEFTSTYRKENTKPSRFIKKLIALIINNKTNTKNIFLFAFLLSTAFFSMFLFRMHIHYLLINKSFWEVISN